MKKEAKARVHILLMRCLNAQTYITCMHWLALKPSGDMPAATRDLPKGQSVACT